MAAGKCEETPCTRNAYRLTIGAKATQTRSRAQGSGVLTFPKVFLTSIMAVSIAETDPKAVAHGVSINKQSNKILRKDHTSPRR